MSIQLNLYKNVLKHSGFKKWTTKPEELPSRVERYNAKHAFEMPKENYDHLFSQVEISLVVHNQMITFQVIRMVQKTPAEKAILYCPGNVLPLYPTKEELEAAWKLGDETHRDIWLPLYPHTFDSTINGQVACIYEVYKEMLKYYEAGAIDFYGYSLGATILLDFFPFNNSHEKLASPRYLFLISPVGNAVGKEAETMKKISRKDPLMSYTYGHEVLKGSDDFTHFRHMDLANTPETWLYYGDCDIYSAKAPSIISTFKMDLIPIHAVLRKECPHNYCIRNTFKEAKEDYEEIRRTFTQNDPQSGD